jgi:hypothetical protein
MKRRLVPVAVMTALLLGGRAAPAAENSFGVGVGYVKAKEVQSTIWFAADYRFHVGRSFAVAPEISYWKKSAAGLAVSASIKDLEFGVNALMVLHPSRGVQVFAGGGGGVHDLTGDLALGTLSVSNSVTKGGLDVLGGIDLKAGDVLSFFLAARYDWVLGLSGARDPRRLDQAKFYGGFRLHL